MAAQTTRERASSSQIRRLTFRLREGVKWHDGRPFTAKDVQCTWDLLLGRSSDALRTNPHKAWYQNVEEVTTDSDFAATFRLRRPQPALIALLASGFSPVYPCHVSPREMRQHPIGTGPFKFLEFKSKESIKVVRNQDYWKKGRPYQLCSENVGSHRGWRTCSRACWISLSTTHGTPSFLIPPSGLGISTRLTGCGWQVPESS